MAYRDRMAERLRKRRDAKLRRERVKAMKPGKPVTQYERVQWARADYQAALCRSNAVGGRDPALRAAVLARKTDYEREKHALRMSSNHAFTRGTKP